MDPGIIIGELCSSETLPEVDVLFTLGVGRLSCHNPGVRALAIGTDYNVSIKAEAKE